MPNNVYKKAYFYFQIPVESINIFMNSELEKKHPCMILKTGLLRTKVKISRKGMLHSRADCKVQNKGSTRAES